MRHAAVIAFVLGLASHLASAQQPPQNTTATATMRGRVITADGRPLPSRGIHIAAISSGQASEDALVAPNYTAVGPDGAFTIDGLFGERMIQLIGMPANWEIDRIAAGRRDTQPFRLTGGEDVEIIVVIARASIRGRVVTTEGEPLANAQVTAEDVTSEVESGRVSVTSSTPTSATGEFAIRGLADGRYLLEAKLNALRDPRSRLLIPGEPAFVPTFYPGGGRDDAVAVEITRGSVVGNVTIPLRRNNLLSVSGHVIATDTFPVDAHVLVPGTGDQALPLAQDGEFTLAGLQPGRYALWARSAGATGLEAGWQLLDVAANMSGVQIILAPAATIHGRLLAGDHELPAGLRVAAAWTFDGEDVDVVWRDQADVDDAGHFELDGLFGERTLHVVGLPPGWKAGRVMHEPATVDRFRLTPGKRVEVTITIAPR